MLGLLATRPALLPAWGVLALACCILALVLAAESVSRGELGALGGLGTLPLMLGAALPVPLAIVSALLEARRVTLGRVAPRGFLGSDAAGASRLLAVTCLLAGAPSALMLWWASGSVAPPATLLLPWALASVALALMLMQGAAWHGLAPALWLVAPFVAVAGVLAWGWPGLRAALDHAGPLAHATMLAALPLAWRWLRGRLSTAARFAPSPQRRTPRQHVAAITTAFTERWRYVDARAQGSVIAVFWIPHVLSMNSFQGSSFWTTAWGADITAWYLPRLLALTLIATLLLRSPRMHWRWLLAPTGRFRQGLGQRIVASTLGLLFGLVLVVASLAALLALALGSLDATQTLPLAWKYGAPWALDIVLAVALAAWLRALMRSLMATVMLQTSGLAIWLLMAWGLGWPPRATEAAALWQRDAAHAVATLVLAALFTALANRAWARADLDPLGREPRAADAF